MIAAEYCLMGKHPLELAVGVCNHSGRGLNIVIRLVFIETSIHRDSLIYFE